MEILMKIYYFVGVVSMLVLPLGGLIVVFLSSALDEKEWVLRIPKRKK